MSWMSRVARLVMGPRPMFLQLKSTALAAASICHAHRFLHSARGHWSAHEVATFLSQTARPKKSGNKFVRDRPMLVKKHRGGQATQHLTLLDEQDDQIIQCKVHSCSIYAGERIHVSGLLKRQSDALWLDVSPSSLESPESKDVGAKDQMFGAFGVRLSPLRDSIVHPELFLQEHVKGVADTVVKQLSAQLAKAGITFNSFLKDMEFHDINKLPIKGFGEIRKARMVQAWKMAVASRALALLIEDSVGVMGRDSTSRVDMKTLALNATQTDFTTADMQRCITSCIAKFGTRAHDIVAENPYKLLELEHTLPLSVVDVIGLQAARKLDQNAAKDLHKARQLGHIISGLRSIEMSNKTLVSIKELLQTLQQFSNKQGLDLPVSIKGLKELVKGYEEIHVLSHCGQSSMQRKALKQMEHDIANRLKTLAEAKPKWDISPAHLEEVALVMSPSQLDSLRFLLKHRVAVLTGGPGVGKTTVLSVLLSILTHQGLTVELLAPTGRAAVRMKEVTKSHAATVHMAAKIGHGMKLTVDAIPKLKPADVYIVDEASMLDLTVAARLLEHIGPDCTVYFVGDPDQLPPVGPAQLLWSMVESPHIPTTRLTEVFRQEQDSAIVKQSQAIASRDSSLRLSKLIQSDSNFSFIPCPPEKLNQTVVQLVTNDIPNTIGVEPKNIQVLCPRYTHSEEGNAPSAFHTSSHSGDATTLNTMLSEAIHAKLPKRQKSRACHGFHLHDKVLQTVNDYERDVMNGQVGTVSRISKELDVIDVSFGDKIVEYSQREHLQQLIHGFAMTIHKSQGSEFPVVVVPLASGMQLNRSFLYTAITRAKLLTVCVGNPSVWFDAMRSQSLDLEMDIRKWSLLPQLLDVPQVEPTNNK
eukprot:m.99179 g.99179  ORF g.99179 m.99179 type:complete len:870 (-) comp13137_c0_seq6:501-3110(-)